VTLAIELTAEEEARLTEIADELGISADRLVRHLVRKHLEAVEEKRTTPTKNEFDSALSDTVRENEELYRRLAQ
jgi:hypothetical protein